MSRLLRKDKNLPVSETILKKDLFDLAVIMNRKITASQLFESHLYWLFKKGVSFGSGSRRVWSLPFGKTI